MADFQISGELNLENIDQVTAELSRSLGKGTAEGFKLAQKFVRDILRIGTGRNQFFAHSFDSFERTLKSLESRMKAMGRLASSVHVDPNIFAAADKNLDDVMRRLHQIDDLMEGTDDRATRRALQAGNLQRQLLSEDMAGIRKLLSLKDTAANAQAQQDKQRARERMQADRIASAQSIVAQQTSAAQAVASTRAASQRRVEIIRASIGQIRALERGLGAVFRGTANAIGASFSGLGRTISSALSRTSASTSRLDRQFTQGIGGALSRRESSMRTSFSRQERILSQSVSRQSATIARLERVLSGGVLGAATGRGAAAGLGFGGLGAMIGGGALGATLLTSGFQRFSELERLNKQFIALTGSQEQAVALMEEVKAFAKVTPFDLVGVADLAKGFLAIGTNAKDVIPQVKTIADAVALTGGGTDELVRIQRAIGQVVSAGRLQGDELNQLAENLPGLNIRQLLADQLTGGDTAALVKMQEAGEISADMFLNGILTGLSTDPRLAGAAEALAGTLSGRFANLKEGFADVGAALIGVIAGPMAAAFGKLQEIFSNLAQFIRGEDLSAALNTLRTAIGGAAAAIGALLIARAAGQAIQILAIAARALLSPFGIIVAIVGAVGAAFAVLMENSAVLRGAVAQLARVVGLAFSAIGGFFSTLFAGAGEAAEGAGNLFETIGDSLGDLIDKFNRVAVPWIKETMIPALQDFATILRDTVFPAVKDGLGAAVDFIRGTVIPGFQTAFSWIAENVFPIVQDAFGAAVDFIKGTIIPGFQAFISFMGGTVVPFIRDQLVGAFEELQDFISNFDLGALARIGGVLAAALGGFAIAGPVGAAVAGAGAAVGLIFNDSLGASILGGLQKLGGLIRGALEGPFNAVKDFLGDFFSADNLLDVLSGFLDIVEKVGEIIGNIASDPRLIAGLAAFAALAAATALKFVQGLIIGIGSNLPELYSMLKEAGAQALQALASALTDTSVLSKLIPALLVGGALLSSWRVAGTRAGVAAGTGFAEGLKQRAFGGALTGAGPGAIGGSIGGFLETLFLGPQGQIDRAARRAADTANRAFRSNFRFIAEAGGPLPLIGGPQAAQMVATVADNITNALGPSSSAAVRIRSSLRALFKLDFRAMADIAGGALELGKSIGRTLVSGIAGGVAGFQVGKSIAESGGGFFDQLLGVGGTAAALATINVPAGIAAGAFGTVGAAIGEMNRQAEESEALIATIAEGFIKLGDVGSATALQELRRTIGTEFTGALEDANVDIEEFVDAGLDIRGMIDDIVRGSGSLRGTFDEFVAGIGPAGKAFVEGLGPGVDTVQELRIALINAKVTAPEFASELKGVGLSVDELSGLVKALDVILSAGSSAREKAAAYRIVQAAIGDIASEVPRATTEISNFEERLAKAFKGDVPLTLGEKLLVVAEGIQGIVDEADTAREALDELFGTDYGDSLQSAIDEIITGLENLPSALGEIDLSTLLGQAKFRGEVGGFVDGFKDAIRTGIETGEITAVPDIVVQKDTILAALTAELEKEGLTPTEAQFLMDATVALNEVTEAPTLADILAKLFPDGAPTLETGVKVDVAATLGNVSFGDVPGAKSLADMLKEKAQSAITEANTILIGGGPRGKTIAVSTATLDYPVTISPDVTVAPLKTDVAADIRAKILGGENTTGTVSFPVTISPLITVAPLKTDVMGQIRARIFGAGGGNVPIAGGLVASATSTISFPVTIAPAITVAPTTTDVMAQIRSRIFGTDRIAGGGLRTIPFPVTIAPQITVAPTTTDVMGQIRARIFGGGGTVGVNRSIAFPVTINPQITIGNFAQIVAIGPQIVRSIVLGIAIGIGQLTAAMQGVVRAIASAAPAAGAAGRTVASAAVQGLVSASAPAVAAGVGLAQRFAAGIRSGVGAAVSAARAVGQAASANVGTSTSGAFQAGANLANAVAAGIRSATGNAVAAARSMAQQVAAASRSALQIRSPSKLFHKMGVNIGEGMAAGLDVGAVIAGARRRRVRRNDGPGDGRLVQGERHRLLGRGHRRGADVDHRAVRDGQAVEQVVEPVGRPVLPRHVEPVGRRPGGDHERGRRPARPRQQVPQRRAGDQAGDRSGPHQAAGAGLAAGQRMAATQPELRRHQPVECGRGPQRRSVHGVGRPDPPVHDRRPASRTQPRRDDRARARLPRQPGRRRLVGRGRHERCQLDARPARSQRLGSGGIPCPGQRSLGRRRRPCSGAGGRRGDREEQGGDRKGPRADAHCRRRQRPPDQRDVALRRPRSSRPGRLQPHRLRPVSRDLRHELPSWCPVDETGRRRLRGDLQPRPHRRLPGGPGVGDAVDVGRHHRLGRVGFRGLPGLRLRTALR